MIAWGLNWHLWGLAIVIDFPQQGFSFVVGPLHFGVFLSPYGPPPRIEE